MQYDYREIYGWMAEGKDVQVVMDNWTTCSQEGLLRRMLNGLAPEHFRLKPRTVKIGTREVEAPVLEPEAGQRLWYVNANGEAYSLLFNPSDVDGEIDSGRAFASKGAAVAAFSAVTLILRGES